jgi:hypothetical protein
LPGIYAIKIDQGIQSVDAPESVCGVTSMTDEPVYIGVYLAIEFEEPLLGEVWCLVSLQIIWRRTSHDRPL